MKKILKRLDKTTTIKIVFGLLLIAGLLSVSAIIANNNAQRREQERITLSKEKLEVIEITQLQSEIEYGTTVELDELIVFELPEDVTWDYSAENVIVDANNQLHFNQIGSITLKLTFSLEDIETEKMAQFSVVDTQFPEISGIQNHQIEAGGQLDYLEGVRAKDPVDGELNFEVISSVELGKPGAYTVVVVAIDSNGNTKEESFTVTVTKAKETTIENSGTVGSTNSQSNNNSSANGNANQNNNNNSDVPSSNDNNTNNQQPFCDGGGIFHNGKEMCERDILYEANEAVHFTEYSQEGAKQARVWADANGTFANEEKAVEQWWIMHAYFTDGSAKYVVWFKWGYFQ